MAGGYEINSNDEGLRFVRFTKDFRRKRILISDSNLNFDIASSQESNRSLLETLHQDILIRVLCYVDHEDLSTLLLMSKTISKAVIEAKKLHFDNTTPRKKRIPFRDSTLNLEEDDEKEAPGAPMRRSNPKRNIDLSKISTALFK